MSDMRSPLGRVRGLGSAGHGSAHWWGLRLTSLALVFLCSWFVAKLLICIGGGDYQTAHAWLQRPFPRRHDEPADRRRFSSCSQWVAGGY
ncbi:MAG: hypothetical protein WDO70_11200 [Alphaproteobacteria bacterium]